MAKWYGKIGFLNTSQTAPDVWEANEITERFYYGTILNSSYRVQSTENVNDDILLSNRISIVADHFAFTQIGYMCYAVIKDLKWKITNAEIQGRHIILSFGGLYNE